MRDSYPSDIGREQFEPLQAIFEQAKKKTKPRLVAFSEHQDNLSAVKNVLVDGGYTGQPFAAAVRKMLGRRSLSSALSLGWKNVDGYGKTERENSIPACNL